MGNNYSKLVKTDTVTAQQNKWINEIKYVNPQAFKTSSTRKISQKAAMSLVLLDEDNKFEF